MEFRFDANQEFQVSAVEAVCSLFQGQPPADLDSGLTLTAGLTQAVPNVLSLTDDALLDNLHAVQTEGSISADARLETITGTAETGDGRIDVAFPNFSVEMETGTGKTYVYIRTALELYRRYRMRKFVIVVPSVAIREGVKKTLQTTEKHFREIFDNTPYRYYVYDSDNLSQVRQFAQSDSVELMVMTIDSFNKALNVIYQQRDRLQGETPVHLIQATRPILILDEPQNMESDQRVNALAALNPLMALRYSATHRNPYNLVYRLTPYDAYRMRLVKRIEVTSIQATDNANRPFVRLAGLESEKRTFVATVALHKLMANGTVKEQIVKVKPGDALVEKSGSRPEYAGFVVDEINVGESFVRFANNVEVRLGESVGADKSAIFEAQIRYSVEEHFRKAQRLRPFGIKPLTLFFIDRVGNYRGDAGEPGVLRQIFERAFNDLKAPYDTWNGVEPSTVQAAYFAEKRRKGGSVELQESTSGKSAEDERAYDLIMRDKEKLLLFEEPVSFIFSHSALREGWDNPNVFQICTLNQTGSDVKKRQEVGRGMRLARNQAGDVVHDEQRNVLTVVANESYERYVSGLQSEIAFEYQSEIEARFGKKIGDLSAEDRARIAVEYGEGILPPRPVDGRKRGTATLRKEWTLRPEFEKLWEQIKHKTRYSVTVDTDRLIAESAEEISGLDIRPPRITATRAAVEAVGSVFETRQMTAERTVAAIQIGPPPNVVDIMASIMEHSSPPMRLTRRTMSRVFAGTRDKAAAMRNPHEFAVAAVRIVKERLADQLVKGIQYHKIDEWYEMTHFESEITSWQECMTPAKRSPYDHVVYDSEIERKFVEDMDKRSDVLLYVKLPGWFKVPTPIGEYNPDWAIVMQPRDEFGTPAGEPNLYLVRETKDKTWKTTLRPDERRKIDCGDAHFTKGLNVSFRVVTEASELP